ncbi:MAG TPA: 5'/3'-nucleotidase SurE, partial [Acidobacteriota bacterium]|nr:5'/3'-nucleotidase SurE [Acidobacteriota bacterium]
MKRLSLSILLLAVVTCAYGEATPAAQPAAALDSFNILVSNDDGYDAPGIRALVEGLRSLGRVAVAAPAVEQ